MERFQGFVSRASNYYQITRSVLGNEIAATQLLRRQAIQNAQWTSGVCKVGSLWELGDTQVGIFEAYFSYHLRSKIL